MRATADVKAAQRSNVMGNVIGFAGSTLAAGAIATGKAVWLAWHGAASLWDEYLKLIALIGGGFPGVFALGLLTRRANASGVIVGTPR